MTWSLFENTSPNNVFVFSRHDVNMDMFNSYVVIANDYDSALNILQRLDDYFAPWSERGTQYRRMVKVWDLRTRKEMAECRRTCMRNRLDYYSEDMLRAAGL